MQPSHCRREFLKTAGFGAAALGMTAASYARVVGANERISIGLIGCGGRGRNAHMPGVHRHDEQLNAEFTAVADPWRLRREQAAARGREWYGRQVRQFVSYRDLLALDDLDAVMIASCDHQHTTHLEAAAEANKDVYCEKPLAMNFEKLKRAVDTAKAADIVCQVGTQVRSMPTTVGCRELYQSGVLGNVSRIEQVRNGARPYWYWHLVDVKESDVDWEEFLMDVPMQPFRAEKFAAWYGYREFSDGPIPGLASHFIDLIHYVTGAEFPESVVAQSGTFTWIDDHHFTCPDQVQATWTYPEGFMVSYTTNFGNSFGNRIDFMGNQGTLELTPWTAPTVSSRGAAKKSKLPQEAEPVQPIPTPDHFLDWLQCIRNRGTCRAPIDAGYQHAVAVIMAVRASDTGRRQIYDRENRQIREG